MGIGHMAVTVSDMDRSLKFYTEALGFERAFDIDNPENGEPWIVYLYAGGEQFLELFYGGTVDNEWRSELRGFNHVCLCVGDIQAMKDRIEGAGYALTKQPKLGVDGNWQCWVTDPDGVRVEIMQLGADSPHMRVIREKREAALS